MTSLKIETPQQIISDQLFAPIQKFQTRWFIGKLFKSRPRKMPEISVENHAEEQLYIASYITNKSVSLWFIHKNTNNSSTKISFCSLSAKASKEDIEAATRKAFKELPISTTLLKQISDKTNSLKKVTLKKMQATIKEKTDITCYLPA